MNRRIRLITDNIRGQIFFLFVPLVVLFDDGDVSVTFNVAEIWRSIVSRLLDFNNERRIIRKLIVDAANTIISGKIKRKIRIASERSRLKLK